LSSLCKKRLIICLPSTSSGSENNQSNEPAEGGDLLSSGDVLLRTTERYSPEELKRVEPSLTEDYLEGLKQSLFL
jgi:hypothetical protein